MVVGGVVHVRTTVSWGGVLECGRGTRLHCIGLAPPTHPISPGIVLHKASHGGISHPHSSLGHTRISAGLQGSANFQKRDESLSLTHFKQLFRHQNSSLLNWPGLMQLDTETAAAAALGRHADRQGQQYSMVGLRHYLWLQVRACYGHLLVEYVARQPAVGWAQGGC